MEAKSACTGCNRDIPTDNSKEKNTAMEGNYAESIGGNGLCEKKKLGAFS